MAFSTAVWSFAIHSALFWYSGHYLGGSYQSGGALYGGRGQDGGDWSVGLDQRRRDDGGGGDRGCDYLCLGLLFHAVGA
jgi:hypothetical protein